MARIVTDAGTLQSWVKEKQTNEQRMLFRLNNVFNSPIPRNKIRMVVRAAFERMWAEAQDLRTWPRVMNALVAEGNLAGLGEDGHRHPSPQAGTHARESSVGRRGESPTGLQ